MKKSNFPWFLLLFFVVIFILLFYLDNRDDNSSITNYENRLTETTFVVDSLTTQVNFLNDSVVFLNTKLNKIYKLTWDNIDYWLKYFGVQQIEIVKRQIYLETGNLSSKICIENRNLFGMRMPTVRETTAIKKQYGHAMYQNYIESIEDYALWQKRFYNGVENYYEFLNRVGYATEPSYVKRLKKVTDFMITVNYEENE